MAVTIRMPKMSDTMTEGVIARWLKKVGDKITSGDILAEVETDKATMDLESYEDGFLLHIGIKEKEVAPVDGIIAIIGEKGENINELLKEKEKVEIETKKEVSIVSEEKTPSTIDAEVIRMPKMSDTMTEGIIATWLKKVGDKVVSGDILAEVETDKATMDLESYEDGELLYIGPKVGESVAVDEIMAIIGKKGANYKALLKNKTSAVSLEKSIPHVDKNNLPVVDQASSSQSATLADKRTKASPLAKSLAKKLGYNISQISGTGDFGRIIKRDVEAYKPSGNVNNTLLGANKTRSASLPKVINEESFEEIPVSQMRKTIANRLSESKFDAPHFYITVEINMDKAIEARKSLNEVSPIKISFNDLIVKATATALRQHPSINVSWLNNKIRLNHHIHIGIAVAVDEGLLVPVVRFADNKSLSNISSEIKTLAKKAVDKQLAPQDWEGSTFTISNLGMFGIEEFTAIINPPNACILAVGAIKQTAIIKEGQLAVGNVIKLTLTSDHRVVDGALGAKFLQTLKTIIEDPIRILI